MSYTETITNFVNNGDSTSVDISDSTGLINILSAEVRWKGSSYTEQTGTNRKEYVHSFGPRSMVDGDDYYAWSAQHDPDYIFSANEGVGDGEGWPEIPDDATLVSAYIALYATEVEGTSCSSDVTVENYYDSIDEYGYDTQHLSDYDLYGYSVFSAELHEEKDFRFDDYSYVKVTDTGDCRNEIRGLIHLEKQADVPVYTTYQTTDPSISGAASASISGSLSDGEWSSWQDITDQITPNSVNTFEHSISDSGEGTFELHYEYEIDWPDRLKELRISDKDTDTTHLVALADPTDSSLMYDSMRMSVNGTTYVIDLVDADVDNGIDWLPIHHPTHGELQPRSQDQI